MSEQNLPADPDRGMMFALSALLGAATVAMLIIWLILGIGAMFVVILLLLAATIGTALIALGVWTFDDHAARHTEWTETVE